MEETEKEGLKRVIEEAKAEIRRLNELKRVEENKIKAWQLNIDKIESEEKGYGKCQRCKDSPAVTDYNGKGYYLCTHCDSVLTERFEDEYK
jgi:hypothetical protein